MVNYDNSLEKRINALICSIDKIPVINSVVPEESSYLGIKLRISEEGFQQSVQGVCKEFTDYLDNFYQDNTNDINNIAIVDSTFSRLLSKYQNSVTNIKESPKRIEWRHQSKHFILSNPNSDFEIEKTIKYTREANMFFLKMSGVQLLFLERLIEYLIPQLESIKNRIAIYQNEGLNPKTKQKNHSQNVSKDTVYYFTVKKEFRGKYNVDIYLNKLHSTLKNDFKYINCTPVQFKNLFKPVGNTKTKTPTPIVWLSAYSHLAYLVKCLVDAGFIPNTKQPSFNQIAKKLFYDNEEGKYFKISSVKSDVKNPFKSPYAEIKSMVNRILRD